MFRSRQCILVRILSIDDFDSTIILCERLAGTVGIIERIAGLPTSNGEAGWTFGAALTRLEACTVFSPVIWRKNPFRVFCQVWYNENEPYVGHVFRAILDGQLVHQ